MDFKVTAMGSLKSWYLICKYLQIVCQDMEIWDLKTSKYGVCGG